MAGNKAWYVLYTKPRNEKKVAQRLYEKNYETYCPVVETLRIWSDRRKKIKVPLFTSYVFVRLEEAERVAILGDPGVLNFVFWLGKPAIIRDEEIEAIRFLTCEVQDVEVIAHNFEIGDDVVIEEGPFKGLKGQVDVADKNQVIVYIEALQCKIQFRHSKRFLMDQASYDK